MKTPSVKQFNETKKNEEIHNENKNLEIEIENDYNKPIVNYCTNHIVYDKINMSNFILESTLGNLIYKR